MEAVLGRRFIHCFASTHSRQLRTLFPAATTSTSFQSLGHRRGRGWWPGANSHSIHTPGVRILKKQSSVPVPCIGSCQWREDTRTRTLRFKSSSTSSDNEVVYVAPLRGAVRAVKVFSLSTAVAAFFGGPVLVWLGNPSVPLAGRVIMSSLVMLVGLGTTGVLHWLVKGS